MFEDILPYEGTVIRPPSEADSLIFQLTLGCSDNRCVFCPAYKDKPFRVKDAAALENEMAAAARAFPQARRIFFADGDALIAPQAHLERAFAAAARRFPKLSRIGVYGSVKSLETKSVDDLRALKRLKLGLVYLGFETGDEQVYRFIRKYGSPEGNLAACRKVKEAGITVNVTVVLGLGGRELWRQHAVNTAGLLNAARPDQVAALTLMVAPGTPLEAMARASGFTPLDRFGFLEELHLLLVNLADFRCQFFSNHASNYYPVRARFPKDRAALVRALAGIVAGRRGDVLAPESLRGL